MKTLQAKFKKKSDIFKAISEPNRIRILLMLQHKPMCVCEITAILDLTTATVSKHLSILSKSGFLIDQKDGKWINYCLKLDDENSINNEIIHFLSKWYKNEEIIRRDANIAKVIDRNKLNCSSNKCSL